MAALIAWRRWSLGTSARHQHFPVNPVIFHVRLQGNVPKANNWHQRPQPSTEQALAESVLEVNMEEIRDCTNVTTLKYFLPVEELRILNTHHDNILLNPPQSSAPDDVCCFLLVYRNLVSFFSKYFFSKLLVSSITEHYRLILLFSFKKLLKTHTRVQKLRFFHFDYKVFSISKDFPNFN